MYLKELEIFGFKSFPGKTALKFEPGITVVVGPNGCGKSNVFDSIKWALGEQSPKSLRGAKMEDIIFNGTENHPPLNYTEVVLNFSNEDKYLPIDYKEVSIARRLYRSGESQYFINKNIVRLKDVQELFMGTGVGESTYSFVEQGKIEALLTYKPEDKRLIFDEASGIVKYKERKRETLRRLDETEENILRLEDILFEVRRQIRYLDRQVEKAKKYKQTQEKLIEVEKKIATLQFSELEKKISGLTEELNLFKGKEKDKEEQLQGANNRREDLNNQLKLLRGKLEEAVTKTVSLNAQIESSVSHSAINEQRIKEIQERSANLELSRANLNQRLQLQDERNREEVTRMGAIEIDLKRVSTEVEKVEGEKEILKQKVESAKKKINEEKIKVLDSESKKAQFHNFLIEIQTKFTSLANRKKRLFLDKAKQDTLLSENRDNLKEIQEASLEIERSLGVLREKRSSLVQKDKDLNARLEDLRSKLTGSEKEFFELKSSYAFLKDLRMKYETFSVQKKVTLVFDEEPKNINKLVVSLQGTEFKKEGESYTVQTEAKVISFEEKQLEERMVFVENEIEDIKKEREKTDVEKNKISEDLSGQNIRIEEVVGRLQQSLQEKEGLTREVERLEEEAGLLSQEEKVTFSEIEDSQQKQKEIEKEMSFHQEDLDKAKESLSLSNEIVDKGLERIKDIDLETARSFAHEQSLHKEKETLESKISFFRDEIDNIQTSLVQINKENEENEGRVLSFNSQIEGLRAKIEEDKFNIAECTKKKQAFESEEVFLNKNMDEVKEGVGVLEKEVQALRDSAYNKKLEVQSLEYEKEKIKDYLCQVYEIEFDWGPEKSVEESVDILSVEKEKLGKRKKSLGEVNLVAIEEFEELKKRENFLDVQKQDLVTSKDSLKKAIAKINRTSKELFLDIFTRIEQEFKKNFKFLFNGGRANLILIDKDNVLESGVEIEVQPPGKKLQNVSLLSGGEKALTAIALIFAIFSVKPSPLCVLDEIDAPLDDSNVDRFNHLLKKFASFSQFIVITHNKKTMSNADVLYGVTMQERGISKLVSVKFAAEKETVPS